MYLNWKLLNWNSKSSHAHADTRCYNNLNSHITFNFTSIKRIPTATATATAAIAIVISLTQQQDRVLIRQKRSFGVGICNCSLASGSGTRSILDSGKRNYSSSCKVVSRSERVNTSAKHENHCSSPWDSGSALIDWFGDSGLREIHCDKSAKLFRQYSYICSVNSSTSLIKKSLKMASGKKRVCIVGSGNW